MRITSRGPAAVTVGLVSAVLLMGCGSNSDKPTVLPTLPTSSAAPTTTPAPTSVAPVSSAAPTSSGVPTTTKPAPTKSASRNAALAAEATSFIRSYYRTVTAAQYNK